jgi:hypothetical protein
VQARSNSGEPYIRVFQDAFQLDQTLADQSPSVIFSNQLFTSASYNVTETYDAANRAVKYVYTYDFGSAVQLTTSWQRVLRVTIEYTMTSATASVSWYSGIPNYTVTDGSNTDITGTEEAIPGSLSDFSLPVELASFTAQEKNGLVTLTWTTESELNNLGFNIYRSTGTDDSFEKVNQKLIEGAGTSSHSNTYTFIDNRTNARTTYFYKLEDIDVDGKSRFHGPVEIYVETASIPDAFILKQNYPNPFNPTTTITYGLPEANQVRLQVFNMIGERVKSLVQTHQPAGNYTVEWNGTTDSGRLLPSGIYFYRLDAGTHSDMKKMILAR